MQGALLGGRPIVIKKCQPKGRVEQAQPPSVKKREVKEASKLAQTNNELKNMLLGLK